jgi:hypothetical protein
MEHQIFCDGIGRISIIGGIVRLDLMSFSPTETDANGQPRAVLTHRVVMGMDAFVRSSEKVLEITRQITKSAPQAAPPQVVKPVPVQRPQEVPPQFRRESVHPEPPPAPPAPPAPPPPKRPFP